MSTDDGLHVRDDPSGFISLSLPPIGTNQPESASLMSPQRSDDGHRCGSKENCHDEKNVMIGGGVGGVVTEDGIDAAGDDTQCQTPTSTEHKIPPMLKCPPAPRKPRREFPGKRKAVELTRPVQFFEAANREAVEDVFMRLEWAANSNHNLMQPARRVVRRRNSCHGFMVQFR